MVVFTVCFSAWIMLTQSPGQASREGAVAGRGVSREPPKGDAEERRSKRRKKGAPREGMAIYWGREWFANKERVGSYTLRALLGKAK